MLFATKGTQFDRTTYFGNERALHAHKGFNWCALAKRLTKSFELDRLRFSPISLASSWLASQVWFVCKTEVPLMTIGSTSNVASVGTGCM